MHTNAGAYRGQKYQLHLEQELEVIVSCSSQDLELNSSLLQEQRVILPTQQPLQAGLEGYPRLLCCLLLCFLLEIEPGVSNKLLYYSFDVSFTVVGSCR